jgi:hypothetical protein
VQLIWDALQVGGEPATAPFYSYPGSLTEPPCTENINWMVFVDPVSISISQLNTIKNGLRNLPQTATSGTNNRPTQVRGRHWVLPDAARMRGGAEREATQHLPSHSLSLCLCLCRRRHATRAPSC